MRQGDQEKLAERSNEGSSPDIVQSKHASACHRHLLVLMQNSIVQRGPPDSNHKKLLQRATRVLPASSRTSGSALNLATQKRTRALAK